MTLSPVTPSPVNCSGSSTIRAVLKIAAVGFLRASCGGDSGDTNFEEMFGLTDMLM